MNCVLGVAESFRLPLVQPYVGGENSFEKGVNFAVAGATALDHEYLEARGIYNPVTNVSLGVQMHWFKQLLGTLHGKPGITYLAWTTLSKLDFGMSNILKYGLWTSKFGVLTIYCRMCTTLSTQVTCNAYFFFLHRW